jgi:DNA-binding transcriptional MocR family regulator
MALFRRLLEHKVICVPGEFFDVNPGKRRGARTSRFKNYVRFSFGPEESRVVEGIRRIQALVAAHQRDQPGAPVGSQIGVPE